jgi:amylosucrase
MDSMNQAAKHRVLAQKELQNPKSADQHKLFEARMATNLGLIQNLFFSLYPEKTNQASFQKLMTLLKTLHKTRPTELKLQDLERLITEDWMLSEKLVGMQLYADLFNKDLNGLSAKIPYLEKLGVNLIHLMPITTRPKGENDGGYAVNSYVEVDPQYGTGEDLLKLTKKMRSKKIYLMLDFVVNHTSNEYDWAKKAAKGSKKYQAYYYTYPDREIPDAFEETMPEVFPTTSPGNFTYDPKMKKWVMTVFNSFQWDLNYSNPEVFMAMLANLVEVVNQGVDVVRFDALAFLWKKIGTISQNLPEAHRLIALFKMCLQTIAPGVRLLAEAIVAPKDILAYFGEGQTRGNSCDMAYNATLMALLWNSIATKKTNLLRNNLKNLPSKPVTSTWINYIRCHDDIGLGFEDKYIYELGWDAQEHRKFLLNYYCQKLDWSPAMGQIFMYNPKTQDGRITGSAASLLGLEKAIKESRPELIEAAVNKIIMMHGIILAYGGIPMLYAGDEIGALNEYSYLKDNTKREDSRWLNRPYQDWELIINLHKNETPQAVIFKTLKHLIEVRKKLKVFADHNNRVIYDIENPHILAFERTTDRGNNILVLANFDEKIQMINGSWLIELGFANRHLKDLVSSNKIKLRSGLFQLNPFQIMWLSKA